MSSGGTGAVPAQRDPGGRAVVARNAFNLVMGQVATTALAIVLSAALGRSLGPADFGVYFLVISFSSFAYVVVDWGQIYFVIREVARAPERGGEFLGTALALRTAGGFLVAGPTGLICWALGYDPRTCWLAVAFIGVTLPFFAAQSFTMVFRSRDRMGLEAAVSVVNKAAILALVLPALALGMGLSGVALGTALGGTLALMLAARLYRRVATGPLRPSWATAKEMLVGGSALVTMLVAVAVQPYLDVVILSRLAPPDHVGWFGAAKNIMGTLLAPSVILGAAVYPRLSRAARDLAWFGSEVQATLRPMLWLGALAGVGTFLFADTAISLVYGQRNFGPAGIILKVYGPGLFLIFIDVLFGNALTALNRVNALAFAKVASVVLSTGLDLLLIPIFQKTGNAGLGVVISFVVSEIVVFGGALLLMPRGTIGMHVAMDLGRALGSAGVTGLVFHWMTPLPFYVGVPACVAVFAVVSFLFGLLRRSDVQLFQTLLKREPPAVAPPPAECSA
jgi:O-antigen/teichoic acid export membrane protein